MTATDHAIDAADAAELLGYACQPTTVAGKHGRYHELTRRYRDDVGFADLVRAVASGLGLRVLGHGTWGVAVIPESSSPLALRTSDLCDTTDTATRLCTGLAHAGVAATCYPTPQSLADTRVITVTAEQVVDRVTEACAKLDRDHDDHQPAVSDGLRQAWREWLALPHSALSNGERLKRRASRLWFARDALRSLSGRGLLTGDGPWRTTDRYRLMVIDAADDARLRLLSSAADHCDEEDAECDS